MSHIVEIVNIKDVKDFGTLDGDVYIGRYNSRFGDSVWGNPYTMENGRDRADVISLYKHYFERRLVRQIDHLANARRLGCWCRPLPCHGQVILDALQQVYGGKRIDKFTLKIE